MLAVIADLLGDFMNRVIGGSEQLDRLPDPGLGQEADKGRAQLFFSMRLK